jgi:hypothetical protein
MFSLQATANNQERRTKVEIDVTTIRTTKELPRLLYIVPWQEAEIAADIEDRQIVIHDLFGNFFQPMVPAIETKPLPLRQKNKPD